MGRKLNETINIAGCPVSRSANTWVGCHIRHLSCLASNPMCHFWYALMTASGSCNFNPYGVANVIET